MPKNYESTADKMFARLNYIKNENDEVIEYTCKGILKVIDNGKEKHSAEIVRTIEFHKLEKTIRKYAQEVYANLIIPDDIPDKINRIEFMAISTKLNELNWIDV